MRVLRYLPTNLSAPEIARELSVSVTTVRTHISHLFAKLGAHRRTEAVARARDLGLLAPSPMRRADQPRATELCPGPLSRAGGAWPEQVLTVADAEEECEAVDDGGAGSHRALLHRSRHSN